jgi:outer membrane protein assembly factor BamB
MFNRVNKFDNIFKYFPLKKDSILISNHSNYNNPYLSIVSILTSNEDKRIITDIVVSEFFYTNEGIILKDDNGNGRLFNGNEIINIINDTTDIKIKLPIEYKDFIVCFKGIVKERKYGCLYLKTKKVEWIDFYFSKIEIINNYLIGRTESNLLFLSLPTLNLLWQKNLETDFPGQKISRLVGVYENVLIVGIASDWLIGMDTESGSILWKEQAIPNYYQLNKTNGYLISITTGYSQRDAKTGILLQSFKDQKILGLDVFVSQRDNFVIVEDHIITTDWKKGIIGAFNTVTHQFDWIHKEEGVSFPAGQPIKYFEPYLFVMDSKQTLHIFQKENPSI